MKILIIGGYGTFGGRLVRLLNDDKDLDILIAGRSGSKARAFAVRVGGVALIQGIELDRQGNL